MDATKDPLTPIRHWLAAFNANDRLAFVATLADDVTFTMRADGIAMQGPDAVARSYWGWRAGFSTLRGEIADSFASSDRAAIEMIWTGMTAQADRPVHFRACFLFRLRDGHITEIVDYYDQLTYKRQYGLPLDE